MYEEIKKIIAITIIPSIFLVYGIIALKGIEISKKIEPDDAWMYISLAIVGYILAIVAYVGEKIINHKKNNDINNKVEINRDNKNQQKESNNYFKTWSKQCKLALIIWVVYTVLWVMKLPYTNDFIYIILTLLGLYCLRKEQKSGR